MLAGKTALITGSTSGIGKAMAETLAAAGANVALNGFGDAAEIEAQRESLETQFQVKASYHAADMSKPAEIEAMMAAAADTHGPIDILINNAGIQHVSDIADFPPERWDAIIAVNLSSAFHTTRLALPSMREAGWGRIINVASVHGLVASKHKSAYVAAKHGIVGLTKATALDAAGSGVTCNALCPGWVLTALVQKQVDALAEQEGLDQETAKTRLVSEKMPASQFVTPEQLAGLTLFLCGPNADQMSGASLPVDGAWTAQ
ncbi:3-hydroxybutyrate dehydrogenase [Aquibaculum arenosum]|uniref:3-hydroxybutyrate dehydrogenase n=1 Tax=Aquibaculum arenosum TaxID=3032591 RepID=A0ABT5YKJ1_9PROT|nr:3-hydroxybutyrate dehydrogenase [Fodinicurvata sp. CAU 1616]MDF2095305.1 3-hydroxybutyrate dehydrogenase [Fodinicurvata sp. CAU 1616]